MSLPLGVTSQLEDRRDRCVPVAERLCPQRRVIPVSQDPVRESGKLFGGRPFVCLERDRGLVAGELIEQSSLADPPSTPEQRKLEPRSPEFLESLQFVLAIDERGRRRLLAVLDTVE